MKALRRSQSSSSSSLANLSPPLVRLPSPWVPLRALLVVSSSRRGSDSHLRSPWSRRKRKHALSRRQWSRLFTDDKRFRDGGVKFLKKVRRGGVDPEIRAEVWPFLLGVYNLNSSEAERKVIRRKKRKEYIKLRLLCLQLFEHRTIFENINEAGDDNDAASPNFIDSRESPYFQDAYSTQETHSIAESRHDEIFRQHGFSSSLTRRYYMEESSGESSEEEPELFQFSSISADGDEESGLQYSGRESLQVYSLNACSTEDFATWRRIIRLDALRADAECIAEHKAVSDVEAYQRAEAVGLQNYEHLDPRRIYHAARLVEILEAYAVFDQEIGYCQGMSDLLSPIIAVIEEDHEAFWCFVGFMRKARHNFRLDETGIRRQLNLVSKIIKSRDRHLYRHLEKLDAEDCSFVYRMVVVLFRRELSFEQTLCLWEVMWADQTAIRAGVERFTCGTILLKAPPTNDLLLYAIAACILQRRKLIVERYRSMDEIVKECNSMTGQLDVWKLLDDAHNLVATLHNKV